MCVSVGLSMCINFSTNIDVPNTVECSQWNYGYIPNACDLEVYEQIVLKRELFYEMHKLIFMIFSNWHLPDDNYFLSERITQTLNM